MGESAFRKMVSCVLLCLLPGSVFAADTNAAMLYTNGSAWVNGAHVPRTSSAIFSGDLLQTRSDSAANINQAGSTITVQADSLVQFQGTYVDLQHGAVTVSTAKGIATTAGDVKIAPATNSWTEFNVVDVDGMVKIAARKGDVTITDGKEVLTLAQGQETSRPDTAPDTADNSKGSSKKDKKRAAGAAPAAGGGLLNSPYAIAAGGAAIVGVTTWVLIKSSNPASPTQP
jgi:hypothetical protein